MCCHPVRFLDDDASAKADEFRFLPAGPYTIEDLLKGNFVMTCSTVLRRDLIPPLPRWFSKMKLGDWPLFALAAQQGQMELMTTVIALSPSPSHTTATSLPPPP